MTLSRTTSATGTQCLSVRNVVWVAIVAKANIRTATHGMGFSIDASGTNFLAHNLLAEVSHF